MSETVNQQNILFPLLRSAVFNEHFLRSGLSVDEPQMEALVALAKKHDLLHLVAYELERDPTGFPVTQDQRKKMQQSKFSAAFRYGAQVSALQEIAELFEQAQIAFIPLKGAVLRDYYPQPWMRTSADIDLLVRPESMQKAGKLLEGEGYRYSARTDHDKSYVKEKIHIELHYLTIAEGPSGKILQDIWNWAEVKEGRRYEYVLRPEMFVFYHIAHMAKHFLVGGSGIRSFLDLKIIEDQIPYDREKESELLAAAHLETFMESCVQLANFWFGDQPAADTVLLMGEYIQKGSGLKNNSLTVELAKGKTKGDFFLYRLFLPFKEMKVRYPVLEEIPFLLPFLWIHRLLVILFTPRKRRHSRKKFKTLAGISSADSAKVKRLLEAVGLDQQSA